MSRMDEILTIREVEIKNFEKKINLFNEALESKDKILKDYCAKLEEVQAKLDKFESVQKHERRILTKLSKNSEEPRIFSKSNERKDTQGNGDSSSF